MTSVLIASFAIMLASLAGKLTVWRLFGDFVERHLTYLVSFAAGVLLVILSQLAVEIVEHAGSIIAGVPWIFLGAIVILVAFRFIPDFHHHHDSHEGDHTHSRISANRILVSDGIHNVGDGVLLVTAFAVSPVLGMLTTASIFMHEAVQEVSEFFVLRGAGLSVNRALLYNFLVSGTILIGAIGGYYLLAQFEKLEVPLLGIAAGAYAVVVFYDLIPHSIRSSRNGVGHAFGHVLWFLGGLVIMSSVAAVFGH